MTGVRTDFLGWRLSSLCRRPSVYADSTTVFMHHLSNIHTVKKKVIVRYELRAGYKINSDKSEGRLLVPRGMAFPYLDSSAAAMDPSASIGYDLGPASNWSEIGRKSRER